MMQGVYRVVHIEFDAAVQNVKTLVDNGIRITLDLPEDAIPVMAMLAECQRQGIYLHFTAGVGEEAGETKPNRRRKNGKA